MSVVSSIKAQRNSFNKSLSSSRETSYHVSSSDELLDTLECRRLLRLSRSSPRELISLVRDRRVSSKSCAESSWILHSECSKGLSLFSCILVHPTPFRAIVFRLFDSVLLRKAISSIVCTSERRGARLLRR